MVEPDAEPVGGIDSDDLERAVEGGAAADQDRWATGVVAASEREAGKVEDGVPPIWTLLTAVAATATEVRARASVSANARLPRVRTVRP
jgi:hypothetical protein